MPQEKDVFTELPKAVEDLKSAKDVLAESMSELRQWLATTRAKADAILEDAERAKTAFDEVAEARKDFEELLREMTSQGIAESSERLTADFDREKGLLRELVTSRAQEAFSSRTAEFESWHANVRAEMEGLLEEAKGLNGAFKDAEAFREEATQGINEALEKWAQETADGLSTSLQNAIAELDAKQDGQISKAVAAMEQRQSGFQGLLRRERARTRFWIIAMTFLLLVNLLLAAWSLGLFG